MNIRLNFSHQAHLRLLSEMDHDFYIPHDQAQWHGTAEKDYLEFYPKQGVPGNLHFDEDIDDPDVVVKGEDADIHLVQNLRAKPRKNVINAYQTETLLAKHNPSIWFLLGKGVDTERFTGWWGDEKGPIITTDNEITRRSRIFAMDQIEAVREEFGDRFHIYGYGDGCEEWIPHERLHKELQKCSVYVNFAKKTCSPTTVVEAMSVGCPVVTVPFPASWDFITNGYNGIITHDVVSAIKSLFDNSRKRHSMGSAARRKAVGKYDMWEYIYRWDYLFNTVRRFKR